MSEKTPDPSEERSKDTIIDMDKIINKQVVDIEDPAPALQTGSYGAENKGYDKTKHKVNTLDIEEVLKQPQGTLAKTLHTAETGHCNRKWTEYKVYFWKTKLRAHEHDSRTVESVERRPEDAQRPTDPPRRPHNKMDFMPTTQAEGPLLEYNPDTRNDFVRFVFILVAVMLSYTIFVTVIFMYNVRWTVCLVSTPAGMIFLGVCAIAYMINHYTIICYDYARRVPCNYICLFIGCFTQTMFVVLMTAFMEQKVVLTAFVITFLVVCVCIGISFTNFDFTRFILLVIVAGLVISLALIAVCILKFIVKFDMKPIHMGLLVASAGIISMMLIIELQMVLGGKSVEIGEDDYALAAYLIYTSIIDLFLTILRIMDLANE